MKRTIAFSLLAAGLLFNGSALAEAVVGQPAPAFKGVDAAGKPVSLDQYKGKYVVLEWVNPECPFVKKHYDSGNYPEALEMAVSAAGYDDLRREQSARRASGDAVQIGVGIASYVEITAPSAGHEFGTVRMTTRDDGSVVARVITGTSPYGQGHRTTWAMLVSDRLGVPMENVEVLHGDTDIVPTSEVSGGSRSTQLGGTNVWLPPGS